jgi:hypothetical protein
MTIDTGIYSKLYVIIGNMQAWLEDSFGVDFTRAISTGLSKSQREDLVMMLEDPDFKAMFIFHLSVIKYHADNFITFHSSGVTDILNGQLVSNVSEIDRIKCLHKFLTSGPVSQTAIAKLDQDGIHTHCFIEHQPSKIGSKTNNKSTAVSHNIAFYYIDQHPILVNPKLKNKLALHRDLNFDAFVTKYKHLKSNKDAIYKARKEHSKANLLYLAEVFELDIIQGISKSCLDDLADATLQVLAYLVENKLFPLK